MYHRIAEETFDPWGLSVHPSRFEEQMEWLASNRKVLPLVTFAEKQADRTLAADSIAVTFDDGYACLAKIAAPILHRLGFPATVFIPAELMGRGREYWWDDIQRLVLEADVERLEIDRSEISLGPRTSDDEAWQPHAPPRSERQKAFQELWSILHKMPDRKREASLDQIRGQTGMRAEPRASHRSMTEAEARSLTALGVECGSHGLTHAYLPALGPDEKEREIADSMDACLGLTGEMPQSFAYPYGRYDEESRQIVAKVGYNCACSAEHGFVRNSSPPFALPRIAVGNWDLETFSRKLLGAR